MAANSAGIAGPLLNPVQELSPLTENVLAIKLHSHSDHTTCGQSGRSQLPLVFVVLFWNFAGHSRSIDRVNRTLLTDILEEMSYKTFHSSLSGGSLNRTVIRVCISTG